MQRTFPTYAYPVEPMLSDLPRGLGWRQIHMLRFCRKYPGLHTIDTSRETRRVALSLVARGLLHLTDCGMATAAGKPVYMVSAT